MLSIHSHLPYPQSSCDFLLTTILQFCQSRHHFHSCPFCCFCWTKSTAQIEIILTYNHPYLKETTPKAIFLPLPPLDPVYLLRNHLARWWPRLFLQRGPWTGSSIEWVLSWEVNWGYSKRPLRNPFLDYQKKYVTDATRPHASLQFHAVPREVCQQFFTSRVRRWPVD